MNVTVVWRAVWLKHLSTSFFHQRTQHERSYFWWIWQMARMCCIIHLTWRQFKLYLMGQYFDVQDLFNKLIKMPFIWAAKQSSEPWGTPSGSNNTKGPTGLQLPCLNFQVGPSAFSLPQVSIGGTGTARAACTARGWAFASLCVVFVAASSGTSLAGGHTALALCYGHAFDVVQLIHTDHTCSEYFGVSINIQWKWLVCVCDRNHFVKHEFTSKMTLDFFLASRQSAHVSPSGHL